MKLDSTNSEDPFYFELLNTLLYDVIEFPSSENTAKLFLVVKNQRGKSFIETNCSMSRFLPYPQEFLIERILCAFLCNGEIVPVAHRLYGESSVRLLLGDNDRPVWESPCWAIAHPAAVFGKTVDPMLFERWEKTALGKLSHIHLSPGLTFCGELVTKNNEFSMNYQFALLLEGQKKRPAQ